MTSVDARRTRDNAETCVTVLVSCHGTRGLSTCSAHAAHASWYMHTVYFPVQVHVTCNPRRRARATAHPTLTKWSGRRVGGGACQREYDSERRRPSINRALFDNGQCESAAPQLAPLKLGRRCSGQDEMPSLVSIGAQRFMWPPIGCGANPVVAGSQGEVSTSAKRSPPPIMRRPLCFWPRGGRESSGEGGGLRTGYGC